MEYKFQAVYNGTLYPCEINTIRNHVFVRLNEDHERMGNLRAGGYLDIFPVVQFTGHCDKNGREIYNGHILRYGSALFLVRWNQALCSCDMFYFDTDLNIEMTVLGWSKASEMEIVGHIKTSKMMGENS